MRTLQFWLKKGSPDEAVAHQHCRESRRLYNTLVCITREHMSGESGVTDKLGLTITSATGRKSLDKARQSIMHQMDVALPHKVAQGVVNQVIEEWRSFFARKGQFRRHPGYARTYNVASYNPQAISSKQLKRGVVRPSGWVEGFTLPDHVSSSQVQCARVMRVNDRFRLDVLYHEVAPELVPHKGHTAAIDVGVNILATVVFDIPGVRPVLVHGNRIRDWNQWANKGGENNNRWGLRNRRIHHALHTLTRRLVNEFVRLGVGTVVVGWNEGFKASPNMGRVANQKFVCIPHKRMVDMLSYKLAEHGITLVLTEESYTSQASALDGDDFGPGLATGKRVSRGWYVRADGSGLHADVNAAYNIMRKSRRASGSLRGAVVVPRTLAR